MGQTRQICPSGEDKQKAHPLSRMFLPCPGQLARPGGRGSANLDRRWHDALARGATLPVPNGHRGVQAFSWTLPALVTQGVGVEAVTWTSPVEPALRAGRLCSEAPLRNVWGHGLALRPLCSHFSRLLPLSPSKAKLPLSPPLTPDLGDPGCAPLTLSSRATRGCRVEAAPQDMWA